MSRLFASDDWTEHPALRVLVLAWVAVASQTPGAASAWGLCLSLCLLPGLVASWRRLHAELISEPLAPHDLPAPTEIPTRRRTDAVRSATAQPARTEPLLKPHHDELTGLARSKLLQDSAEPWQRDLETRQLSLCVLHVGLDGFDTVAERYGPEAADDVLAQVAKRLRHLARDDDRVMRFDAAEFVLLLSCPTAEAVKFARAMAARIVNELRRPVGYRTVSNLHIGCSVGSALWPFDGDTLVEVLHHAEEALADARHSGRGQTRQYAGSDEPVAA
ncbi:MAG: GGDEF domain-containing protein [Rhizobacter sp.]